jgi:hypothetical protein
MSDDSKEHEDDHEFAEDELEEGSEEDGAEEPLEVAKCSFCGRTAFDVERLVGQGRVRICNICIKEFHGRLKPKPDPKGTDPKN